MRNISFIWGLICRFFLLLFSLALCINMWFCCVEYEMIAAKLVFSLAQAPLKRRMKWIYIRLCSEIPDKRIVWMTGMCCLLCFELFMWACVSLSFGTIFLRIPLSLSLCVRWISHCKYAKTEKQVAARIIQTDRVPQAKHTS